jgi:hypothetical protein
MPDNQYSATQKAAETNHPAQRYPEKHQKPIQRFLQCPDRIEDFPALRDRK